MIFASLDLHRKRERAIKAPDESRGLGMPSAEAEYAIEHPLMGDQSQALDNASALALFCESVRYLQDGNAWMASTLVRRALKAEPSLHTHARDALLSKAQSCRPGEAGAVYYWLGIHSEHLKDNHQAAIWYAKAIDAFHELGHQKQEARAHCNLGTVKMRLEDPSGMEEYEKAITLNPMDGIAHINIGTAFYLADKLERALDAFAEAIWADPNRYGPVVISRLKLFAHDWEDQLEKIGHRVAKKQGINWDTLAAGEREGILQAYRCYERGNAFFEAGRYEEAMEQFEKGTSLSKNFAGNFLGISMTAMQMIEGGAIPKDRIPFYLEKAEKNSDVCLRIAPTHLDYLRARNAIRDYKKRYRAQ